jgi:DNA-binding transcriptional LysR family regulator
MDPLFYRTANGITPTIKALDIAEQLPELLFRLNAVFDTASFDPSTCDKNFFISLPSLMSHAFILPLMMQVGRQAPNICISEYPVRIDPLKPLATGKLDFAIHIKKPNDKDYNTIDIGTFIPTIYARKGHPILSVKTDRLAQCSNYNFAELIIENDESLQIQNPVELMLAEQKFSRKITARSGQLSVLVKLLQSQDLLLISSDLLTRSIEIANVLTPVYKFENTSNEELKLYLISHKRTESSEAHQWIKQQLLSVIGIM